MGNKNNQASVGTTQTGIRYNSKLSSAVSNFASAVYCKPVANPLKQKYGSTYNQFIAAEKYRLSGNHKKAREAYRTVIADCPEFLEAYTALSKLYEALGDYESAILWLKKRLGKNQFCYQTQLQLAKCYGQTTHFQKALRHYKKVLKLTPQNLEAAFGVALTHEQLGQIDRAIAMYESITHLVPDFLPAYNNLGTLYIKLGVYQKAETIFRALTEKSPNFYRGHLGLAITYDRSGQTRKAIKTYQVLLQKRPHSINAAYIKDRIGELSFSKTIQARQSKNLMVRVK
ncbi:MAG: tetratricopeptide repeat protein [Cyanobacteria bacterium P01_H01_bin.74]